VEVALLIGFAALLARGARALGVHVRARPTDAALLGGLFAGPGELGWPPGVQEEDRDRIWSWAPRPQAVEGDLIDRDVAPVPVGRVR
jgi:hypothetical protein